MDGILLFNKPILWTSHDAVDFIRRKTGQRLVGHAGTLDPMATGLLVLLVGGATRLAHRFMEFDKEYTGSMTLGFATDTQDLEGKILSEAPFEHVRETDLAHLFTAFLGPVEQIPPPFSAARRGGKKLYALARRGILASASPKEVWITKLSLSLFDPPEVYFSLSCSKGTYVRTLCDQLGKMLGCGAVLSALVRQRVGPFSLSGALGELQLIKMNTHQMENCLLKPHDPHLYENLSRIP